MFIGTARSVCGLCGCHRRVQSESAIIIVTRREYTRTARAQSTEAADAHTHERVQLDQHHHATTGIVRAGPGASACAIDVDRDLIWSPTEDALYRLF